MNHPKGRFRGSAAVLMALVGATALGANFTTERFSVQAEIRKDRSVEFVETIAVNFNIPQHGIHRTIPLAIQGSQGVRYVHYQVEQVDASPDGKNFAPVNHTETFGGDLDIRIGDADRTLAGPQTYRIRYLVDGAITDFPSDAVVGPHSEFYWNIIPGYWDTSIESAGFQVAFPQTKGAYTAKVFVGPQGSTNASQFQMGQPARLAGPFEGSFSPGQFGGKTVNRLPYGSGATLVLALPLGSLDPPPPGTVNGAYMRPENSLLSNLKNGPLPFPVSGAIGLVLAFALPLLYFFARSNRLRAPWKNHAVMFEPPPGLDVMDAAYLCHPSFRGKDFVAGIISLAQKKACRLHRTDVKGFTIELLGAQTAEPPVIAPPSATETGIFAQLAEETEERVPDVAASQAIVMDPGILKTSEGALLVSLAQYGSLIDPSMLTATYAQSLRAVRSQIGGDLKARGYLYSVTPPAAGGCLMPFIAAAGGLFLAPLAGPLASAGLIVGLLGVGLLMFFTTKFTPTGEAAVNQLNGLKVFISSPTEKRNLTHFAATDFTQSLYDKLLPYAVLFGAVRQWTSAFDGITLEQPDWYVGPTTGNYWVQDFMADSDFTDRTVNSAVTAATSSYGSGGGWASGSSGFGGGGSSGGGGGGGGGGSW